MAQFPPFTVNSLLGHRQCFGGCFSFCVIVPLQERTGVQMIMIQDDPMPTGADKPLRITGDPHKVQVGLRRAQCAPLSFQFTLNFTHFIPLVFCSDIENLFVFTETCSWALTFLYSYHYLLNCCCCFKNLVCSSIFCAASS